MQINIKYAGGGRFSVVAGQPDTQGNVRVRHNSRGSDTHGKTSVSVSEATFAQSVGHTGKTCVSVSTVAGHGRAYTTYKGCPVSVHDGRCGWG